MIGEREKNMSFSFFYFFGVRMLKASSISGLSRREGKSELSCNIFSTDVALNRNEI
jgi:hypothetical protein